jgi:hypothetical protein
MRTRVAHDQTITITHAGSTHTAGYLFSVAPAAKSWTSISGISHQSGFYRYLFHSSLHMCQFACWKITNEPTFFKRIRDNYIYAGKLPKHHNGRSKTGPNPQVIHNVDKKVTYPSRALA